MLRILAFIVVVALVGYVVYSLLEYVLSIWICPLICDFALDSASDYLIENGRGFYEDKTKDAIYMEASVRTWLLIILHVALVVLTVCFVSSRWAFWIVPPWSIKIGVLSGVVFSGFCFILISFSTMSMVGRLMEIDEKGLCHFSGLWQDNFTLDVSKYWKPDDYPPTDKVYMVNKFLFYLVVVPIEYYDN